MSRAPPECCLVSSLTAERPLTTAWPSHPTHCLCCHASYAFLKPSDLSQGWALQTSSFFYWCLSHVKSLTEKGKKIPCQTGNSSIFLCLRTWPERRGHFCRPLGLAGLRQTSLHVGSAPASLCFCRARLRCQSPVILYYGPLILGSLGYLRGFVQISPISPPKAKYPAELGCYPAGKGRLALPFRVLNVPSCIWWQPCDLK